MEKIIEKLKLNVDTKKKHPHAMIVFELDEAEQIITALVRPILTDEMIIGEAAKIAEDSSNITEEDVSYENGYKNGLEDGAIQGMSLARDYNSPDLGKEKFACDYCRHWDQASYLLGECISMKSPVTNKYTHYQQSCVFFELTNEEL